ncbi:MAG: sigma-70 family RNA polymerase sigma factor [Gemmataceae bacterium]
MIDSVSHVWDTCKAAYGGRLNRNGAIPFQAWTAIKRPYKELLHLLLSSPVHVLIYGRQAVDYGADEASGELKNLDFRMRVEGETAYEPDVLLRLEAHKSGPKQPAVPLAHVEKDRTGVLAGKTIEWPSYDCIARPLLGLLAPTQAPPPSEDEVSLQDAEALARDEQERARRSEEATDEYTQRFGAADSVTELQRVGKELTPAVKAQFTPRDLERVRRAYTVRLAQLAPAGENGRPARAGRPTYRPRPPRSGRLLVGDAQRQRAGARRGPPWANPWPARATDPNPKFFSSLLIEPALRRAYSCDGPSEEFMGTPVLRTVLRHALSRARDAADEPDARLLRRLAADRDEAAFAALVARHGPLVWGVCRNLLPDVDADDAFQAAFLTLLKAAPEVADRGSLAGWLHRVAYRVALKARRTATRRRRRERAAAVPEAAAVVADSAWDRLLGAVHEEVDRLPEALRGPFVLCCLEGRRVTDAAAALGWKVGTLSARLRRAKQRVLDQLARRGLPGAAGGGAAALAAATGSAAVPLKLFDKTVALGGAAGSAAPAVVHLSLGVLEMKLTRVTVFGAALIALGLLVTGVGPALVPWAAAQSDPRGLPGKADDEADPRPAPKAAARWEFAYVEAPRPLSEATFEAACRKMEPAGFEYCGTQEMTLDRQRSKGAVHVLVFKRSAAEAARRADAERATLLARERARAEDVERLTRLDREKLGRSLDKEEAFRRAALDQLKASQNALAERDKAVAEQRAAEVRLTQGNAARDEDAAKRALADKLKAERAARDAQSAYEKAFRDGLAGAARPPARDGEGTPADPLTRRPAGGESIRVIPVGEGDAEKLAKTLADLFGGGATFRADPRGNALIVKADAATQATVQDLLDRLERQAAARRQRDKAPDPNKTP